MEARRTGKGHKGTVGMVKFRVFFGVWVTEVCAFVKTQGMLYLGFVHFTVCNFYLKKKNPETNTKLLILRMLKYQRVKCPDVYNLV